MLSGIPGDCDSWYAEMAEWLPSIFHLQPPTGVVRIRYDRFSPYHTRPEAFGLTLEPSRAYAYVYPLPKESLMRLAYFFEDRGQPGVHIHRAMQTQTGQQALQEAVQLWNELWRNSKPLLRVSDDGDQLRITDTRPCAHQNRWTVNGMAAEIHRLCHTGQTTAALLKQLSARAGAHVSVHEMETALGTLYEHKIILRLSGKLLSLGVNTAA
jgi:hypothetical protein